MGAREADERRAAEEAVDNLADAHGAQVVGIAEAVGSEEDGRFFDCSRTR